MSDIEILANIFGCLINPDENVRVPAEQQLHEIRKTKLLQFIQSVLAILQNHANFPPQIVLSALLYVRQSFGAATKAKRSNDPTREYLLIPLDLSNAYLPVIFSLFQNQNFGDYAAKLLGQISAYILSFEPQNQIITIICQQLGNPSFAVHCCTSLEYIFEEIDIELTLQGSIMQAILPLLGNSELPLSIKSKLITVIKFLIPSLPNFLPNESDWANFSQSMLGLTAQPDLKIAAYDFWEDASIHLPQIFNFISNITEISFNDIKTPDQDENLTMSILRLWASLGSCEFKNPGSTASLLQPAIPSFLPLLLSIACNIVDGNSLDKNDDSYPHIQAKDTILAISSALPDQSIPILIQYANQFASSENAIQREIALFCYTTCIDSYSGDNTEEWNNIYQSCIQISIQRFGDPSIRVVSQSIKMVLAVVRNNPELMDFSSFVSPLLQLMATPLADDAQETLSEIVTLPSFSNQIEVFDKLLSFDTIEALDCALKILKNSESPEFASHFISKVIALAEIVSADQSTLDLLPIVISMISIMIDLLGSNAAQLFGRLLPFMMQCYTHFSSPEALKTICSIVRHSGQQIQFASTQVLLQLNNDGSYFMKYSAITSITLYLSKCNISQYFHEFMRLLLQLLEQPIDTTLKIAVLEAINALHTSFPRQMKALCPRLIPVIGTALATVPLIGIHEDDELAFQMNFALLEAIKLLFMNGSDDTFPVLLQMALNSIQNAVNSSTISKACMADIIDVLEIMAKIKPAETKQYIMTNEELNNLFQEASGEDEDLTRAIGELMTMINQI
ncbi:hypothetical protein TRFO_27396 [Tritrichomonas foetus]|uniref:Importin N-terminal domain-containing protein n=1 Tax=Tritrichomonas foetus TaxID=1144522 RepID=A0A1J4K6A6_9EUKA|nr:hypothetical protein TRFO_27396 [Tritrichomonas foetus]|eukprot:OHT05005.1 hypothetical protein TRFO_27396 [Tritrichomonas foetus]